ncbi:MAG: bifunctional protein FolD [Patescibacteria group bacterium]|nr:MAG: bifunctional protein FolD [Patescibacteria group bacterium]
MTIILDGKKILDKTIEKVKNKVVNLSKKPGLAVILVGDDKPSKIYVKNKIIVSDKIGFFSKKILLPEKTTKEEFFNYLDNLNKDPNIHGIIIQYPLPDHLLPFTYQINEFINPLKDVDCFNPINVGKMFLAKQNDENIFFPCTAKGVIKILKEYKIDIQGKKAVVIGRNNFIGKPIFHMLINEDATVTLAHSKTKDLFSLTKEADILIVAVGKKNLIKKEAVKKGAIVIDVGINRDEKKLYGDVDYNDVFEKVKAITPVPGGIGPMTIVSLMENVLLAYELQN